VFYKRSKLIWPFDANNQQKYQNYAQAYDQGNFANIDQNQAQADVQQFVQNAPPEVQQQVFQQHFAQLSPDQRAQLVQMFPPEYGVDPNNPASMAQGIARLKRERPDVLQRIVSHPILLATSVGLAGLVAKHMMAHR
jgi:hypothetical protein